MYWYRASDMEDLCSLLFESSIEDEMKILLACGVGSGLAVLLALEPLVYSIQRSLFRSFQISNFMH